MIIFAWVGTPFVSSNDAIYQTANTQTGAGSSNYDAYSDPKVDALITQGRQHPQPDAAPRPSTTRPTRSCGSSYYNLPLFQRPVAIVYQNKYVQLPGQPDGRELHLQHGVDWGEK